MLTPASLRPVTLAELAQGRCGAMPTWAVHHQRLHLLDYTAMAVPAGHMANGLPRGVTLSAPTRR